MQNHLAQGIESAKVSARLTNGRNLVDFQELGTDGRVVECARLESVFTLIGDEGSNPSLSAISSSMYEMANVQS